MNPRGNTYSPEAFLDRTYTNAMLIIKQGKIVYENYRNNSDDTTRFIGWSMTKSITSILIGCALEEGRINGKQVITPEWVKLSTQSVGPEDGPIGGYGYQWWTVAGSPAYSAIGLQGQFIYVNPATKTLVVKPSYFPPGDNSLIAEETFSFFAAASAWNP